MNTIIDRSKTYQGYHQLPFRPGRIGKLLVRLRRDARILLISFCSKCNTAAGLLVLPSRSFPHLSRKEKNRYRQQRPFPRCPAFHPGQSRLDLADLKASSCMPIPIDLEQKDVSRGPIYLPPLSQSPSLPSLNATSLSNIATFVTTMPSSPASISIDIAFGWAGLEMTRETVI